MMLASNAIASAGLHKHCFPPTHHRKLPLHGQKLAFPRQRCMVVRADAREDRSLRDNESKEVLEAFFLGKAFAEALTERLGTAVGELLSDVGRWQAEQQRQVRDFQEEVQDRARLAKLKAVREAGTDKSKARIKWSDNGATPSSKSATNGSYVSSPTRPPTAQDSKDL